MPLYIWFGSRLAAQFIKEVSLGVVGRIPTHGWCFEAVRNMAAWLCSRQEVGGRGWWRSAVHRLHTGTTMAPPWLTGDAWVEEEGGGRSGVSGVRGGRRERERKTEVGVGFSRPTFTAPFCSFFSSPFFLFVYYNS